MLNIRNVLGLLAILTSQQIFAANAGMSHEPADSKSCTAIAESCLAAGFVRTESTDKAVWNDCMKRIILAQQVEGVKVEAAVVKSCRTDKIASLKTELKEFQAVK